MGRCTAFAAELLRDLMHHPAFPGILVKLVQIDGPIFRGDIEHALLEILKPDV
jgi:hypothetical protein